MKKNFVSKITDGPTASQKRLKIRKKTSPQGRAKMKALDSQLALSGLLPTPKGQSQSPQGSRRQKVDSKMKKKNPTKMKKANLLHGRGRAPRSHLTAK